MKICCVYVFPISKTKQDFATLVPVRLAKVLGEEAEVYVLYSGHINRDRLSQHKIKPYQYGTGIMGLPLLRSFSLVSNVYRLARQEQVDIFMNVWAHYLLLPIIIGAKFANKKVIARVAGIPIRGAFEGISFFRKIRRRFGLSVEKLSLRVSDHIITVSYSLKSTFINRGIRTSKITVISQGVDISEFKPMPMPKANRDKRILFVGRLVENKAVHHAIKAFDLVRNRITDTQFLIVGEGKEMSTLEELCKKLNLEGNVQFLGYVNHADLPRLYNSAHLLVIPSRSEGLSNVVLEAQACGLPTLGTDVGELPIQLGNGRGSIISYGDQEAMAKEMIRLLTDDRVREKMGRKGREYVEREHSFEVLKEKYLRVFNMIINEINSE